MKIGYARVSTAEQNLDLQVDALKAAGCTKIYTEKASGAAKSKRPELERCLDALRAGDTLMVWRLDRLGRSLQHLVEIVGGLHEKGINFKSISDGIIDTTSASGEMVFGIFAVLAQFERRLIHERTMAGLQAARARGKVGGRPKILPTDPRARMAKALHADKTMTIPECRQALGGVSRSTFYRLVKIAGQNGGNGNTEAVAPE